MPGAVKRTALVMLLALISLSNASAQSSSVVRLPVPHKLQHTPVWCWAAALAMVLEYIEQKPIEDCQVLSMYDRANKGPGTCCNGDPRCLKTAMPYEIGRALWSVFGVRSEVRGALGGIQVRQAIDAGSPIIAWVWRTPLNAHVVVIYGYRVTNGHLELYVHDPMNPDLVVVPHVGFARQFDPTFKWSTSWIVKKKPPLHLTQSAKAPSADAPRISSSRPIVDEDESKGDMRCSDACSRRRRFCIDVHAQAERDCLASARTADRREVCQGRRLLGVDECHAESCECLKNCPGREECKRHCTTCGRKKCFRDAHDRKVECSKEESDSELCQNRLSSDLAQCEKRRSRCLASCATSSE